MLVKTCAICQKPLLKSNPAGRAAKQVCSSCREKSAQLLQERAASAGGQICRKCRKRRHGECRFSEKEQRRITACSDWESKNAGHEKRRWAKYEIIEN